MKPLTLELIGSPRLLSPTGESLQIGNLPLGLLAYLAVEKRPVPREHLGGLFWPRSDRSRQLHNLRQAALKIRGAHSEDPLEGNGILAVKQGILVTDVELFFEFVAQGRISEAISIWRGSFLQGFRRTESWELEEWVDQKRLMLERTLATAVIGEVRRALEAESPSAALSLLDPVRRLLPDQQELGSLQVMALARMGRLPEAEGLFKTLELDLVGELLEGEALDAMAEARLAPAQDFQPEESLQPGGPVPLKEPHPVGSRRRWGISQGFGGRPWQLGAAVVAVLSLLALFRGPPSARWLAGGQDGHAVLTCASWATNGATQQPFRMAFDGNEKHRLSADRFCGATWVEEAGSLFGFKAASSGDSRLFQLSPNPENPIAEWIHSPVETARHLKDPQLARASPIVGAAGTLLFSAVDDEGNRDVYALETLTGVLRRLTSWPGVDRSPSIEPGSQRVVFVSERSGSGDLYSIGLDGAGLERLTDHPLHDGAPWVRGDSVLFVRGLGVGEEDGNMDLFLLDLVTGKETRLTNNVWNDYEQVWSPDGRYICWQSEELGHYESEVMVMDMVRGRSWNATKSPGRDSDCLWTPYDNGLLFMSHRNGEASDIYLQSVGGGEALNLTRFPGGENLMGSFPLPEALR